jgi:hypothetical protein
VREFEWEDPQSLSSFRAFNMYGIKRYARRRKKMAAEKIESDLVKWGSYCYDLCR